MPFDIPLWAWALGAVITVAVVLRTVFDFHQKARKDAGDDAAREEAYERRQAELNAAWDSFDEALDARITAIEEASEHPPYIISMLMGEEYPNYSVFGRSIGYYDPPSRYHYGARIVDEPPVDLPEPVVTYVRLTKESWADEHTAYQWLTRLVDVEGRQTGYDDTAHEIGPYGAIDAELEAED